MPEDDTFPKSERGDAADAQPLIVGIGASAGGIQALQNFFAAMPARSGASFVVVVHLDPQSQSELAQVLAIRTPMPVTQVTESEILEPDRVYVIPPGRRLHIVDREVRATPFDEPRGQRAPIDLFFRSLAEHGDGFAIVLSGAGADGAIGVRAVKEAGGIILVQDPGEAEYPSMPRSAIATGVADLVLPVQDLARHLVDLIRDKQKPRSEDRRLDEEMVLRILAHLRARSGHDFSRYKRSTIVRRIARRMQVTRTHSARRYHDYLRENEEEAPALLGDLLISVTTFFRDPKVFEVLENDVLPQILRSKHAEDVIRVWVPGCASGEEAYTLAMLLHEQASALDVHVPMQVFASDLDTRALAMARDGFFPSAIEADVSEERLRRHFIAEGNGYRIRQDLRDMVLFANHDLLKDPPFSRVDLVSCRNLLIYLDRELQEHVCSTFHYALVAGGYLLVGSAETADRPVGLFRTVDRNARIYQSLADPADKPRLMPPLLGGVGVRAQPTHLARPVPSVSQISEAIAHRRALEAVAPPSILVDESQRVLHLSETAGRYIQPSGGALSGEIVDLVRPELRFELRTALHRAFEHGEATLSLPILVRFNGAPHRMHMQVRPSPAAQGMRPSSAIVLFIEGEAVDERATPREPGPSDETVRRLTEELELTHARLRTLREESEASNEELRAANEELQSINEEYRSTSEELETSKEELQSINEELQTVNGELKMKLEAVSRAHNDLQNLMAATDIGTLFLDASLRIKRFTDRVSDLFSITAGDEQRPITDFSHQLLYDDLVRDARTVLSELKTSRHEVRSRAGRWYDMRLRPYRTMDDKIDGVVITFVDITERRQIEEALRESQQHLLQQKRLVELSSEPILIWDFDGGIIEWNRGCEELYGHARSEVIGKRTDEVLGTEVPGSSFDALKSRLLAEGSWSGELRHRTKDGRQLTVESRLQLESFEGRRLVLECTRNITERRAAEDRQRLLIGELAHRVRNTLAVVQAIANQTLRTAGSAEEFVRRFEGRIAALASSHSLLIGAHWQGADLGELARHQLGPYVSDNPDRLRLQGDRVLLPASLATPFGLVLHELATNAAKHGSLSRDEGTVNVSWSLERRSEAPHLTMTWSERGGPAPLPQQEHKPGFGSSLIEKGIPNATVRRRFAAEGMTCTIELPLTEPPVNSDLGTG